MIIALLTVALTLVLGMINLGKPDKASQLKSNKLMRVRIAAQAVAIGLLFLMVFLKSKGA